MIVDTTKKVLYAAVGVPVVTARKLSERVTEMSNQLTKDYEVWAKEGEKVVNKVTDRKAVEDFVEDIGAKMDFDQIQEQVGKLRGQLDDMLTNWRSSFRPATEKTVPAKPAAQPAPKVTAAAKKPVAKKPVTAKTTAAAKKPVAKKPITAKTTAAAKKPVAKKATTTV
ncbi:MAG: hypothetical protein ACXWH0_00915 [Acidimicrobiia bacterium]